MATPAADDRTRSMQEPSADRRARLLQTAAELFFTTPYDSVTTSEIASRSGVAYGLIAHHFGNKRGLYLAAIGQAAETFILTQGVVPQGDTHLERLADAISRHVDYATTNTREFDALMRGDLGSDPEVQAILDGIRRGAAHVVLAELGAPDPPPPLLGMAIYSWLAFLDTLVVEHLRDGETTKQQIVELASVVMVQTISCVQLQLPTLHLTVRPDDDLTELRHRLGGDD